MRIRSVLTRLAVVALLTSGTLLTLARALEPESALGVQLEAFTPLAVVPYAVAALVLAVVARRGRSAVAVGLALSAVVGVGLHGWWYAPMLTGEQPPAPASADRLTVMTANMFFGRADGAALVRVAGDEGVDLLVLQEVTEPLLAELEAAGLGTILPHRAGAPGDSARGTMVFADVPLGQSSRVATSWDSWLVDVDGLSLLAVHPRAPLDVDAWRDDHRLLLGTAVAEQPDLVVGDFNATLEHPPMRALADAGWRSVTEAANEGWQPTWTLSGLLGDVSLPLPSLVQIDHVLTGPSVTGLGSRSADVPGSDHRALVAEVAVP